jgi:Mg2+-importing ATPase
MQRSSLPFWSMPEAELLAIMETTTEGLTQDEAERRRERYGLNIIRPKRRNDIPALLWAQFKSPITVILVLAAVLSFFLHEPTNAIIVLVIIVVSGLLSFWQEHGAMGAVVIVYILTAELTKRVFYRYASL